MKRGSNVAFIEWLISGLSIIVGIGSYLLDHDEKEKTTNIVYCLSLSCGLLLTINLAVVESVTNYRTVIMVICNGFF
jgi:hypothetical protein